MSPICGRSNKGSWEKTALNWFCIPLCFILKCFYSITLRKKIHFSVFKFVRGYLKAPLEPTTYLYFIWNYTADYVTPNHTKYKYSNKISMYWPTDKLYTGLVIVYILLFIIRTPRDRCYAQFIGVQTETMKMQ